ncbi:Acg family FMN-binding oxidoreductase [Nucisporomicrobium flavum]|uniref:Acg family FMN-binding oxidoreductase n=1 Tax=Nucisporomicrobium flavum TaxID=2785915 RepID=UPI003C305342
MTSTTEILAAAARTSLHAPSVFNTQPWRWRIAGDTMSLYADRSRALTATDPEGRLLLLSCGGALHHARVALAAAGAHAAVERFPEPGEPDLLARVTFTGQRPADPEAQRMAAAAGRRRTDRRAYGERPVTDLQLSGLRRAVEAQGAYLHVVRPDEVYLFAAATDVAGETQRTDPAYREELRQWTNRPAGSGDGVPAATAVEPALRRVPVRDFAPEGEAGLSAGPGHDAGAAYVIIFGLSDRPADVLRGGEALSALLLAATAEGLATAPLSDSIEVDWPRHLLRRLLSDVGEPYVAVRLGYADDTTELPAAPRRDAADVIEVEG